ncbi:hypothetical protein FRC17_000307, partial [Serendipita sp. 399]
MITTLFLFLASFTVALPARPNALVRRGYDPADPSLPPAVRTICPNGLNGTTVDEITSFGPEGTNITVITVVDKDAEDWKLDSAVLPLPMTVSVDSEPNSKTRDSYRNAGRLAPR